MINVRDIVIIDDKGDFLFEEDYLFTTVCSI